MPTIADLVGNQDFQGLPESEKVKAFAMFGPTDPEWQLLPLRDKLRIQAHVGITRAQQVLARPPDAAANVDLNTPKALSYGERVVAELKKGLNTLNTADPNTPNVARGANAVQEILTSPLTAGTKMGARALADQANVGGPEAEQVTQVGGDFASQAIQAAVPLAIEGAARVRSARAPAPPPPEPTLNYEWGEDPAMKVVQTPSGPIRQQTGPAVTMKTPEGTIEQNAPASPDRQVALNQALGPDGAVAAKKVVTDAGLPEPRVTVGETPISSSVVADDGVADIALAHGTPDEGLHEGLHVVADSTGTPHPPEDNNAIIDQYLEGTVFKNRERTWSTTSYDPDTDSYMATDEVTGAEGQFSPEAIAKGDPVQPKPSRQEILARAKAKIAASPSEPPPDDAPIEIPEEFQKKIDSIRHYQAPERPVREEQLAPEDYLDWQQTGSPAMSPRDQETFDPSLRDEPLEPGKRPITAKPPGSPIVGPKEAALEDGGVAPDDLTLPASNRIGNEAKFKSASDVSAKTPKTAAEAAKRNTLWGVAGNILNKIGRGREMLGAASPTTAFHIAQQSGMRILFEAFNQMARSPVTGEEALGGFKAFGRLSSPNENMAILEGIKGQLPESATKVDSFMMNFPIGDQPLGKSSQNFMYLNRQTHLVPKVATTIARLEQTGGLEGVTQARLADAMTIGDQVGFSRPMPKLLQDIANAPGVRLIAPYLRIKYNRFMTNVVDMNPAQGLKVLSPEFRARLASGDPMAARDVVNGMIGGGMIGLGYIAAKEGQEDPKSIQGKLGKYSAVATYWLPLYGVGHAIYRIGDAMKNNEAGAGNVAYDELKTVSQALFGVPGIDSTLLGDFLDKVRKGEVASGSKQALATWIGTVTNATASLAHAVDPTVRDTSGSIWGPAISHIPFASKTLPEYHSATRGGVRERPHAVLEAAAVPLQEGKTPVEREMGRLGIVVPGHPTKNAEEDRAFRADLGPLIDPLNDYVQSKEYQSLTDTEKRMVLDKQIYKMVNKMEKVQEPVRGKDKKAVINQEVQLR